MILQVCYNLVNFLQRDEQDKQGRIDYLKSLAESEAKQVGACIRMHHRMCRSVLLNYHTHGEREKKRALNRMMI